MDDGIDIWYNTSRGDYMRDFPVFTTENGVASLMLREVPYRGEAYVTLRASEAPEKLLRECVEFCKVAGAEKIYATGNNCLERFPLHTAIWRMRQLKENIPETDAALFPVTESTLQRWSTLYNERMRDVPNAATMTREDGKKLLKRGKAYFVHRGETLLGIGIADGETIEAVISVQRGSGMEVVQALCSAIFTPTVQLEVASANEKALKLYEKMGFIKTEEISRWFDVKNFV